MNRSTLAVARACLQAYVDKNRAALEALLDDNYHFTSPIDNALDRAAYLRICWPNSASTTRVEFIHELDAGPHAFVIYELHTSTGRRFRNCEMHTAREGKLVATEVYFGWDVPHKVSPGTHADNDGAGHV